ncbi:MAG TPA: hypothetical protein VGV10_03330 [Thermoleophilaceae bacterium]|nr:hypothetical protein [Thermoleophilaceae bacterium]
MGCASADKKEYLREANKICAAADKRLGEAKRPHSLARLADAAEKESAIRKEAITQLSELAPPKDISGGANEVIHDLETRHHRALAAKKAAEDKDRKELRKVEHEGRKEFGVETERAKAVGLRDCAEF